MKLSITEEPLVVTQREGLREEGIHGELLHVVIDFRVVEPYRIAYGNDDR
jgi:hypothetical protein